MDERILEVSYYFPVHLVTLGVCLCTPLSMLEYTTITLLYFNFFLTGTVFHLYKVCCPGSKQILYGIMGWVWLPVPYPSSMFPRR